mmetsp:Transcript_41067/g.64942  ORF Transcript_41067/g.64942 Transcript_41067/m.64942 type:complete len:241 (+) Transcript_41067:835-1557(+)
MMMCRRCIGHCDLGRVHVAIHGALHRSNPAAELIKQHKSTAIPVEAVKQRPRVHHRGHSQQRQPLSELRKGETSIGVRVHSFKHTPHLVEVDDVPQQHGELTLVDIAVFVQIAGLVCSHQGRFVVELWKHFHHPLVNFGQADDPISVVVDRIPGLPKTSPPSFRTRDPKLERLFAILELTAGSDTRMPWCSGSHLLHASIGQAATTTGKCRGGTKHSSFVLRRSHTISAGHGRMAGLWTL